MSGFGGPQTPVAARNEAQTPEQKGENLRLRHDEDLCSVCLSPFCDPCAEASRGFASDLGLSFRDFDGEGLEGEDSEDGSNCNDSAGGPRRAAPGVLVTTRCNHTFHSRCLEQAKSRKAECPNCRTKLTPLVRSLAPVVPSSPTEMRHHIVTNASRVRGNMERARLLRLGPPRAPHE